MLVLSSQAQSMNAGKWQKTTFFLAFLACLVFTQMLWYNFVLFVHLLIVINWTKTMIVLPPIGELHSVEAVLC